MATTIKWNAQPWAMNSKFEEIGEMERIDTTNLSSRSCNSKNDEKAIRFGNLIAVVGDFLIYPWSGKKKLALRYIGTNNDDITQDVNWVTKKSMESVFIKRLNSKQLASVSIKGKVDIFNIGSQGFEKNSVCLNLEANGSKKDHIVAVPTLEEFNIASIIKAEFNPCAVNGELICRDVHSQSFHRMQIDINSPVHNTTYINPVHLAVCSGTTVKLWDFHQETLIPLFSLPTAPTAVEKITDHVYAVCTFDSPNSLHLFDARYPTNALTRIPLPINRNGTPCVERKPFYDLHLHQYRNGNTTTTVLAALNPMGMALLPLKHNSTPEALNLSDSLEVYPYHTEETSTYRRGAQNKLVAYSQFLGAAWHEDSLFWMREGNRLNRGYFTEDITFEIPTQECGFPTPVPKSEILKKGFVDVVCKDEVILRPVDEVSRLRKKDKTIWVPCKKNDGSDVIDCTSNIPNAPTLRLAKLLNLTRKVPIKESRDPECDARVTKVLEELGAWPLPDDLRPVKSFPLPVYIHRNEIATEVVPKCLKALESDLFVLEESLQKAELLRDGYGSKESIQLPPSQMLRLNAIWSDTNIPQGPLEQRKRSLKFLDWEEKGFTNIYQTRLMKKRKKISDT